MDPTVLRDHLKKLHEELSAAPRVDPGSSRLLGELMEDIKELLARSSSSDINANAKADAGELRPAGSIPGGTDASLPDRLEQIALLFAVDHPTLAASSRRLIDILGKVGL